MKTPKFGRGDTIKLLPDTPFPRASGSLFIIRKVFSYSNLNDTVKGNIDDVVDVGEDTPVYYCSDEINYNCFIPESYLKKRFIGYKEVPLVEEASAQDKLYMRLAIIAEAVRTRNPCHKSSRRRDDDGCDEYD